MLTVELYSLKFEIDFGVITDRGVFIEEILAEIGSKVYFRLLLKPSSSRTVPNWNF